MPWSKQSITINGDEMKVGNADFYVRAVISRHDELTVLDIVQIKKNKPKEKKEIEIKDESREI